jgi:hypothetical protein
MLNKKQNNKTYYLIKGLPDVISLAWGFTIYKQIGIDDM